MFLWGSSLESPIRHNGGYELVDAVVWEIWRLKAINLRYFFFAAVNKLQTNGVNAW